MTSLIRPTSRSIVSKQRIHTPSHTRTHTHTQLRLIALLSSKNYFILIDTNYSLIHSHVSLVRCADNAPDITQFNNAHRIADRVTRYVNVSQTDLSETDANGKWKVSAKIQQLLNTLKRPKRRPLPEFYEDNDIELEIAANPKDPNAPKPEGSTMTPVQGEQLSIPAGLPRTLECALQRYGTNSFKSSMATVLDPNGKITTTLTYGKLLSRAQKIAYALSTKIFSKGPEQVTLKPGDRVALVYPNNDPLR